MKQNTEKKMRASLATFFLVASAQIRVQYMGGLRQSCARKWASFLMKAFGQSSPLDHEQPPHRAVTAMAIRYVWSAIFALAVLMFGSGAEATQWGRIYLSNDKFGRCEDRRLSPDIRIDECLKGAKSPLIRHTGQLILLDNLGAAFEDKNDFHSAELVYTRTIELAAPNEANYYRYRRGEAYLDGNDVGMALADFKILTMQNDGYGYLGLGRIAAKQGRFAEAIAQYNKADSLRTNESLILTVRADALALDGEYSKAIADDDAMAAQYSSYGFAYNTRCWDRVLANRDLDTALADCNLSLGHQSDDPDTLDSRGTVKYRQGRWDDAIADFNAALGHNPYLASSIFMRGMSELRKGDSAAGHADIDKAESLHPGTTKEYALYGIAP